MAAIKFVRSVSCNPPNSLYPVLFMSPRLCCSRQARHYVAATGERCGPDCIVGEIDDQADESDLRYGSPFARPRGWNLREYQLHSDRGQSQMAGICTPGADRSEASSTLY